MFTKTSFRGVRAAGWLLLPFVLCVGGGCNSNATIAALGTLVAVGVGVPAATQSHVEVKVEMFNEEGLTECEAKKFNDAVNPLRQQLEACRRLQAKEFLSSVRQRMKSEDFVTIRQFIPREVQKLADTLSVAEADPTTANVRAVRAQLAAMAKTIQETRVPMGVHEVPVVDTQTLAKDFSAISSSANVGPITNEVIQFVLTKPALDVVTHLDRSQNWRPFSEATSHGGTGNHHAVIYFENMGMPILKSSEFNPTKFVEAFGKTYEVAFNALAAAYGVPLAGGSGAGDTSGLDRFSLEHQVKKETERAEAIKKKLLAVGGELVKIQKDIPAADADVKAKAADLAKRLADQAAKLK